MPGYRAKTSSVEELDGGGSVGVFHQQRGTQTSGKICWSAKLQKTEHQVRQYGRRNQTTKRKLRHNALWPLSKDVQEQLEWEGLIRLPQRI